MIIFIEEGGNDTMTEAGNEDMVIDNDFLDPTMEISDVNVSVNRSVWLRVNVNDKTAGILPRPEIKQEAKLIEAKKKACSRSDPFRLKKYVQIKDGTSAAQCIQ